MEIQSETVVAVKAPGLSIETPAARIALGDDGEGNAAIGVNGPLKIFLGLKLVIDISENGDVSIPGNLTVGGTLNTEG